MNTRKIIIPIIALTTTLTLGACGTSDNAGWSESDIKNTKVLAGVGPMNYDITKECQNTDVVYTINGAKADLDKKITKDHKTFHVNKDAQCTSGDTIGGKQSIMKIGKIDSLTKGWVCDGHNSVGYVNNNNISLTVDANSKDCA